MITAAGGLGGAGVSQLGHDLWFTGLAVVLAVVTTSLFRTPVAAGPWALVLAALVGLTWAANVVEGGAVLLGSALAVALLAVGLAGRSSAAGRLLVVTCAVSLILVGAYGL